jgi:hypothetical protein
MKRISQDVEEFFRAYEGFANRGDGEEEASGQFAEVFMAADSGGGRMVQAAALAKVIAAKRKMFEGIGSHRTRLISLDERPLGDWYMSVDTDWVMEFETGKEIELRSTFILFRSKDGLKIVFYLPHQDLVGVLRERGILVG